MDLMSLTLAEDVLRRFDILVFDKKRHTYYCVKEIINPLLSVICWYNSPFGVRTYYAQVKHIVRSNFL